MRAFSFYLFHLPSLFISPSLLSFFLFILVFVIWQLLPFNTTSFQIFGFGDEKKCRRVLGMPVSEFCAQLPYFKKKREILTILTQYFCKKSMWYFYLPPFVDCVTCMYVNVCYYIHCWLSHIHRRVYHFRPPTVGNHDFVKFLILDSCVFIIA